MSCEFRVNPSSGVPIYRQLMDQTLALVASGRLQEGDMLPSVRELSAELEVNPMTVSKAYSLLQRDGALERVPGLGMRIRKPGSALDRRARQDALLPLLRQVASQAWQLGLSKDDVLEQLEPLLEDANEDHKD